MLQHLNYFIGLFATVIVEIIMYVYISKKSKDKSQIVTAFKYTILCMTLWCVGLLVQILVINYTSINPMYIDYFIYIPVVFTPVALFFVSISYASIEKLKFKKSYLLLGIIPFITLLILWTNDFHHLFYKVYSINPADTVFGIYFYIHSLYTYGLFVVDIIIMLKNSIKSTGVFSRQSSLICFAALIPIIINFAGMTFFKMNIYVTPISFSFSVLLIAISILKYNFLDVAPVALKRIVDQMSDSYIVLNKDYKISDCNKAFEKSFSIPKIDVIGKFFNDLNLNHKLIIKNRSLGNYIELAQLDNKLYKVDAYFKDKSKYFNIEISGIQVDKQCVGILILFKDTTQHILDMENLKSNQETLMEKERLATLGQMIGGVAHNLKTPIMSISGATEGLEDLVKEYDESIGDPDVTVDDHHAIAHDMSEWITKIRSYDAYMSDIITAVKGQAVSMNDKTTDTFTIDEMLTRVNILMKHELKEALVTMNIDLQIPKDTKLTGNVNSLVQVVNNLISNSIQAYVKIEKEKTVVDIKSNVSDTRTSNDFINYGNSSSASLIGKVSSGVANEKTIDLIICEKGDNIIISVSDHGCGMPDEVQKKLFKEMITTKGHNGSGLGMFMSYSTIKGNFKGDITFTSEVGKGTTFNVILPRK